MIDKEDRYLTVPEVSKYLKVSTTTIRTMAKDGSMPSVKIGARILFDREAIDAWMRKNATMPKKKAKG